jgi:hypothetical protein
MTRSDELDLLSGEEMYALLADATIVVSQRGPAGVIDPGTRQRTIDAGTQSASVTAIEGELITINTGVKPIMRRSWIVRASTLPFRPAREGSVRDALNRDWPIVEVLEENNARDYRITGERAG